MFTRSGKRIINSPEVESKDETLKTRRSTRSVKKQENYDDVGASKKKHYVLRCSTTEEAASTNSDANTQIPLRTRKSRRVTLKEVTNNVGDMPKTNKIAKRKKNPHDTTSKSNQSVNKKLRKKKKAHKSAYDKVVDNPLSVGSVVIERKNSSGFLIIENIDKHHFDDATIHNSGFSVESFHSAAGNVGSPELAAINSDLNAYISNNSLSNENIQSNTSTKNEDGLKQDNSQEINTNRQETSYNTSAFNIFDKNRLSQSSYKNSTFIEMSTDTIDDATNIFYEKSKCNSVKKQSLIMIKGCKKDEFENSSTKHYNDTKELINKQENEEFEKNLNAVSKERTLNNITDINKTISTNLHNSVKISTPINTTFDIECSYTNTPYKNEANIKYRREKITSVKKPNRGRAEEKVINQSSVKDVTICEDNLNKSSPKNHQIGQINITFEKDNIGSSCDNNTAEVNNIQNTSIAELDKKADTTFEKLNATFEKNSEISQSSIVTSNTSSIIEKSFSPINITSDESKSENIVNTTPFLLDSSTEESQHMHKSPIILIDNKSTEKFSLPNNIDIIKTTPALLTRQGTFTKSPTQTPVTESIASPGRTPFPTRNGLSKQPILNVTRSIEKARNSLTTELPHATRVMFCSPINTPMITKQTKGNIIKSSMKGSNKCFMFESRVSDCRKSGRKRSYTQSDLDDLDIKRQRTDTFNRLSHSRTSTASGKLQNTPGKSTPDKSKADTHVHRKKIPNFALLHQKQFDKMESLDECQNRKAKRAQLLVAGSSATKIKDSKADTNQVKKDHPLLSKNSCYTRFGFKMKSDVNPFTIGSKTVTKDIKGLRYTNNVLADKSQVAAIAKEVPSGVKKRAPLPSLAGSTARKEIAKQTVLRENSLREKRNAIRQENRTKIKGVRTNRRFDLQMQMRNIN